MSGEIELYCPEEGPFLEGKEAFQFLVETLTKSLKNRRWVCDDTGFRMSGSVIIFGVTVWHRNANDAGAFRMPFLVEVKELPEGHYLYVRELSAETLSWRKRDPELVENAVIDLSTADREFFFDWNTVKSTQVFQ